MAISTVVFPGFGINNTALNWISFFVSFHSFYIMLNDITSSVCCFLWCSVCFFVVFLKVLFRVLVIIVTTPLSSFICNFSVNHHPHADDTKLFLISFKTTFVKSMLKLQNVIYRYLFMNVFHFFLSKSFQN
jgi:hypothetical protein